MLTPLKATRAKCVDCMGGNTAEVRRCPSEGCPLFPYRMGHNPNRRRELSGTERDAVVSRLTAGRIAQRSRTDAFPLGECRDTTTTQKTITGAIKAEKEKTI